MRVAFSIAVLVVASCLAGCGNTPTVIPGAKKNGSMFAIPDKKGYVEVRLDVAEGAPKSGRGEPKVFVAYFYGTDGSTPMSPSPTDVAVQIGNGSPMPLAPRESDGSFVSKPGDISHGFRGIVTAKAGGQPIEAIISVR